MPTLEDVARKAGVSRVTASRVLNGTYTNKVSDNTRRRVMQVVRELNYHSSIPARALRSKRTMEFGLLIPDLAFSFMPEVVQGLQDVATDMEYGCLVYLSHNQPLQEERALRTLVARRVDGLVWMPTQHPTAETLKLAKALPVVQFLFQSGGESVPAVLIDQEQGGYLATKHLLDLGHRRIVFERVEHPHSRLREEGYRRAMNEYGIAYDAELLIPVANHNWDAGLVAAQQLLTQKPWPSAIVAASDASAWGLLRAAEEVGARVPDDLSVVGFGNVPYSPQVEVPLTTIDHPKREVGQVAMRTLASLLSGNTVADVVMQASLIQRKSSGPPRQQFAQ